MWDVHQASTGCMVSVPYLHNIKILVTHIPSTFSLYRTWKFYAFIVMTGVPAIRWPFCT